MHTIKNILIIRFRRIGDAVISSVLCSSLKKTFPDANIHYVLNEGIAPVFYHHPDIDKFITFKEEEMKSLPTYVKKVRKIMKTTKYDLIVDTRSTIKTSWFCLFSLSTPLRLGKKKSYRLFHNYSTKIDGLTDEVTKTLTLLEPLRKDYNIQDCREFRLFITDEEVMSYSSYMETKGISFEKPIILCAVAARVTKFNKQRMWDPDKMGSILHKIIQKYDAQLIFNYSGEYEKQIAYDMWEKMGKNDHIFIDIEAKRLRELMALCKLSSFFFGNEGGPRHISQAFDVPSFAIYPPGTDRAQWLPNASERYQGIQPRDLPTFEENLPYEEELGLITEQVIWERIEPMLDKYL